MTSTSSPLLLRPTIRSLPPTPSPPEPSPPPPPPPEPPEPAPPPLFLGLGGRTSLLSGERVQLDGTGGAATLILSPSGPSMLLHTLVSTASAFVMLALACALRPGDERRRSFRSPVAQARPVLVPMAYGVVPTSDTAELVPRDPPEHTDTADNGDGCVFAAARPWLLSPSELVLVWLAQGWTRSVGRGSSGSGAVRRLEQRSWNFVHCRPR